MRKQLAGIEAEFFGERPPEDGHRRNLLDRSHNRVGIALSAAGDDGVTRVACAEEFVDAYGMFSPIRAQIAPGERFFVSGTLPAGFEVYAVDLRVHVGEDPRRRRRAADAHTAGRHHGPELPCFGPENKRNGCEFLRRRIDDLRALKVHVFGHIHGGYGMTPNLAAWEGAVPRPPLFVNAASCDEDYRPINPPLVFELP